MLTGFVSLDATAFDPRKDQRQAINKWSKYILGADYIHLAARFVQRHESMSAFPRPQQQGLLEGFRKSALAQKPADVSLPSSGRRNVKRMYSMFARLSMSLSTSK